MKRALVDLRAVDERMVETRSFKDEIADIEGRFALLAANMVRTARHEFEARRVRIKKGDNTAVPSIIGGDA